MNLKEKDSSYIAGTYARFPLEIVSGKGSKVYDQNGKEYIDLSTGIAVNTFGVADDEWINAVNAQLNTLQHASNLFYTKPCADLAELLCKRTGMKKVFFGNSGAEANECAIKVARKYAAEKKGVEYNTIITLKNSFHGRTITTLAATGQEVFHKDFLPLTEGFVYAEANIIADLIEKANENKCAAIMFECVQGEGGVLPLNKEFVEAMQIVAKEKDLLLIADEVQTGNGRTGKLYAYMHYGITPDVVTTAKGLAGGLPIGAAMLGEKVENILTVGSHGSTFGGNPIACAGAINILNRINDELFYEVQKKTEYIVTELCGEKGIKSVTGMGLMLGIETEKDANEVITACRNDGVIVIKAKNKIRLLPALNIPWDELKTAIQILKKNCE